jgi:hypothetical protein
MTVRSLDIKEVSWPPHRRRTGLRQSLGAAKKIAQEAAPGHMSADPEEQIRAVIIKAARAIWADRLASEAAENYMLVSAERNGDLEAVARWLSQNGHSGSANVLRELLKKRA